MRLLSCIIIFHSISILYAQNPFEYEFVNLCDLNLNRIARSLTDSELADIYPAKNGFIWNDGDNATLKFRPQGITEVNLDCKTYIAVSWYGREDQNYLNRGVRISFVDMTDPDDLGYRHVILVDENYSTLYGLHGGGIHYADGILYVPDTRTNSPQRLYGFDISNIQRVPDEDLDVFYNYRYVAKRVLSYDLPIQASCLSYDWADQKFITGTFKNLCDVDCVQNPDATFSWFSTDNVNKDSDYFTNFFDRLQGLASSKNQSNEHYRNVWVSQSYGRNNPSYLYSCLLRGPEDQVIDFDEIEYNTLQLPPGLEDLHMTEDEQQIWSLTEFGPQEGADNNRLVVVFNTADILPPVINSNDELEEEIDQILNLYPNPSNGTLNINSTQEITGKLSIYALSGQLVFEKNITMNDTVLKLELEPGLYLAQLVSKGKKASTKLLIH